MREDEDNHFSGQRKNSRENMTANIGGIICTRCGMEALQYAN